MKDAEKLVTKCVYSNILRATVEKPVLAAFIAEGGWDVLNDWLQLARADINDAFLRELLKVYSQIPITVNLLKQNSCAKTIKQISKSDNAGNGNTSSEFFLLLNIFDMIYFFPERSASRFTSKSMINQECATRDNKANDLFYLWILLYAICLIWFSWNCMCAIYTCEF